MNATKMKKGAAFFHIKAHIDLAAPELVKESVINLNHGWPSVSENYMFSCGFLRLNYNLYCVQASSWISKENSLMFKAKDLRPLDYTTN